MLKNIALQVIELYAAVDAKVQAFADAAHLSCPRGCGRCCFSEKVEATALEMLPLAFHLFETNQAELLLKRLEANPDEKQCILFRPDFLEVGQYGCSQYPYRALVCRLFGYCAGHDKNGKKRFALCREMVEAGIDTKSERFATALESIPEFSSWGMEITVLGPGYGAQRLPINTALYEALQKVGIYISLELPKDTKGNRPEGDDPDHTPHRPVSPGRPPLRKVA